jgi:GNAT superfamily N-acetyltransferase
VSCADLDLATTADGASAVEHALAGRVIQPVGYRTRGAIRGHLGRVELAGIEVEVLGDVQNLLPDGTWTTPPALSEHITRVSLGEETLPVLNLRYLRAAYTAMGRTDKVRLIEETLAPHLPAPLAQVALRVANQEDVAAVAFLRSEWSDGDGDDVFERRIADWLVSEGDRRTIWLATAGTRPVGMVSLVEYRRMPRPGQPDSRWGYVGHMFVSETFRNQGIGSRLLAALVAAAEERSYARLVLSPSARAVPFFQRAGFVAADDSSGELLLVRPTQVRHPRVQ